MFPYWPFFGGNMFPGTDMHSLDLDWIIREIVKFREQYTNIQKIINDTTDADIQRLEEKNQEIQALWNQLIEGYDAEIASELSTAITSFNAQASQIASQVIASIPADYTEFTRFVNNTRDNAIDLDRSLVENMGYIQHYPTWFKYGISGDTGAVNTDTSQCHSDFIFVGGAAVKFNPVTGYKLHVRYYSNKNYNTFVSAENDVSGFRSSTPGNYAILICTTDDYTDPIDYLSAQGNMQIYTKTIYNGFIMSNEVDNTGYSGNVNVDTVNKIITFGENDGFCRLVYSGKILDISGKRLNYSTFGASFAYILCDVWTGNMSLSGATEITKPSSSYVIIGTLWGNHNTIVNLNVFPCYYVNGIRTICNDARYILSDIHTQAGDSVCRIGVLGDSISSYTGVSESELNSISVRGAYYPAGDISDPSEMWFNQLRIMLRTNSDYIVSAISRSSFTDQAEPLQPPVWNDYRIARLSNFTNMKYVFLFCGVNEQFQSQADIGTPLYKYDITTLESENNTTCRGIELTIRKLQEEIPEAQIIVIIPPFTWSNTVTNQQPYTTFRNYLKQICETYGVKKIIDLAKCITPDNSSTYTIDGIHPNKAGMKRIAHFIANEMLNNNESLNW